MIKKKDSLKSEVRDQLRGGKGAVTFQHYFRKEEMKAKCRLCARLTLPPGASIGMHRHESEEEVFIIESGSGVLDDGLHRTPVDAGDAILTGDGEQHALVNTGSGPLELIAVIMCH